INSETCIFFNNRAGGTCGVEGMLLQVFAMFLTPGNQLLLFIIVSDKSDTLGCRQGNIFKMHKNFLRLKKCASQSATDLLGEPLNKYRWCLAFSAFRDQGNVLQAYWWSVKKH